mgnify:CR=1 FL=1
MEMDLSTQIKADMKAAMRAKETLRLSTIRMLIAAIKQREKDERITLDNNDILAIINKMIKQLAFYLPHYFLVSIVGGGRG